MQESQDFVAILTHSSLDVTAVNRLAPAKAPTYYATLAFPPEAENMLVAVASGVAPGGDLSGLEIGVATNGSKGAKAIPGVPADWFIVRASTQYPPYVSDATGAQLDQANAAHASAIRSAFYAGKRVRAAISAYAWDHRETRRKGISFNLNGVMDAGEDGERLAVGVGKTINAFAGYANPNAKGITAAAHNAPGQNEQVVDKPNTSNPFGGQRAGAQTQQTQQGGGQGNPFNQGRAGAPGAGQRAGGAAASPFGGARNGTPAAGAGNPFVRGQAAQNAGNTQNHGGGFDDMDDDIPL